MEWRAKLNLIDNPSPLRAGLKAVFVVPPLVRPLQLDINESMRCFPLGDLGTPANRDAVYSNLIFDQRPCSHLDGCGSEDLEPHPTGCENVKIAGIRKNAKVSSCDNGIVISRWIELNPLVGRDGRAGFFIAVSSFV